MKPDRQARPPIQEPETPDVSGLTLRGYRDQSDCPGIYEAMARGQCFRDRALAGSLGRWRGGRHGWLFAPAPTSREQPHRFHRPVGDDAVEAPAEGGR